VVQGLLAFTIVGGLIAVPPATGSMMLVSLDGVGRDSLARTAIDAGARLVDAGPFHGSLIVSGQRSALLGMMMERHVLVLRVFSGGCGNSEQVGRELGL
jgi:hypothetical protein